MRTLSEIRQRYVKALERDLSAVVAQLRSMPEVRTIILFGSYAHGRRDLSTDLDLIVIMDSPLDFVARNADLARRIRAGVALDLLAYTPGELERMRDRPFLRRALSTGEVLYERDPAH